jgi:hypothetical protein
MTRVIGKTVKHLPTRGTATNAGEYDETTGTFLPRPRPVTKDQKVGIPPRLKRTSSIGTGGVGQSEL